MQARAHMQARAPRAGPGAPYHGVGGTMNVERPRYDTPMHEEFFRACANAGMQANPDFNNWARPQVREGGRARGPVRGVAEVAGHAGCSCGCCRACEQPG